MASLSPASFAGDADVPVSPPARIASPLAASALVAALFFLLAASAVLVARQPGKVAELWYANAAAVIVFQMRPTKDWLWLLISVATANLLVNMLAHDSVLAALTFVPGNACEILLGSYLLRRHCKVPASLNDVREFAKIVLLAGVLPAFVGAILGAAILSMKGLAPFQKVWLSWFEGSAVGSISVLPFGLAILAGGGRKVLADVFQAKVLALLGAVVAVAVIAPLCLPFPLVYPAVALALLASIAPFSGAALGVMLCSLVVGTMMALGIVKPSLYGGLSPQLLLYLPLALVLVPPLMLAAAVERVRLNIKKLSDSEARYRALYQSTPAMMHSIDTQGRLIAVSDMWLHRLGYERDEVLGRLSVEFLTAESRERARTQALPALFKTGQPCTHDLQMVCKNGQVLDVHLSAVLEKDAEGKPLKALAVIEDITDKIHTAASLEETSDMLRLVLDSLPARISYWSTDYLNLFANRAFVDWFGCTQDQIIGQHFREVIGPERFARTEEAIRQALTGHEVQLELIMKATPDSPPQDMDLRLTPYLKNGQVHGLLATAFDVTARRNAEREIARRDHNYKVLVEGVHDYAIYMLDAQGRVTTWNEGAARNKGYRADEVLGQHFRMFFLPEDVARQVPEQELELAAQDGSLETEGWRQRSDGTRFWAHVLLTAMHDADGHLMGYSKITRDITERLRQQEAIERALLEKETLLQEVYHRVKNNLQVVQSLLNLQRHTLTDDTARAALYESVKRIKAMALVHEKLYQSGNLSAVDLSDYVKDLLKQIKEGHAANTCQIRVQADVPDLQTGLESAIPFGLLLTELVSNSLKHAFKGRTEGTIRVRVMRDEAGGATLTVSDDGVGLPDDFDLASPRSSLGLKLAASLAGQLGGDLKAHQDGGAVFTATLARL